MKNSRFHRLHKQYTMILRFLMVFLVSFTVSRKNLPTPILHSSLADIALNGHLTFEKNEHAAKDFGDTYHFMPSAVLYPKSVSDISSTIKYIFEMGTSSELTVAARGHGHSLAGQAQAYQGVVINMESFQEPEMSFHAEEPAYVDVSAGELWINILQESLKRGLAPKSWTDYLHLTVGGTLSNAGISGQAFRHGPQINNVYQLFYGVLGGLGQFGIITQARIALEQVKWIRVLYTDFSIFSKDQEHLISSEMSFDYIEGFVIINQTGLLNNWRSSFNAKDPLQASQFNSEGRILYCLEVAKYFDPGNSDLVNQNIDTLLSELNYIQCTLSLSEVSYVDFLDRVHVSEIKLREKGLWEVPHPWLNLLIPRSGIHEFAQEVLGNILADTSNGPVLIYPVNKSSWRNRTSMVTPDEDVFYLVAFLSSAIPSSTGEDGLEHILTRNRRILRFCEGSRLGVKQYLAHYRTQKEWKAHFGTHWEVFSQRKFTYDPLAILAPGQNIFQKAKAFGQEGHQR